MARNLLVALFPPILLSRDGKVGMGISAPDVPQLSSGSLKLSNHQPGYYLDG